MITQRPQKEICPFVRFIVIYRKRDTIVEKISGKPRLPLPPPPQKNSRMRKVARFALRAAYSLIWGMGA